MDASRSVSGCRGRPLERPRSRRRDGVAIAVSLGSVMSHEQRGDRSECLYSLLVARYATPIGPSIGPAAVTVPSAFTSSGSGGSGRGAGPPTTAAPFAGSKRLPWQGQAICPVLLSPAYTTQPRWVQIAL